MQSEKSPNRALIGIIVVVLLVAATAAAIVFASSNTNTAQDTSLSQITSNSPSPSASSQAVSAGSFKDGTYSATGSYQTPGGQEAISVKVTLAGGTITDAEVTQQGKTGEAQEFQAAFASGFKSQVVGKKVNEVSLSRVAGSSLTPGGFNSAIDSIEQQAQG